MARWRASRAFRRYLLLEAPGWVVCAAALAWCVRSFELDARIALLLLALWVGKDFALFPLLRDAYEETDPGPGALLVGRVGEARERLDRSGYVRLGSELWRATVARGADPVEPGAAVRVRAVRGLTLVVEAVGEDPPPSPRSPSGAP